MIVLFIIFVGLLKSGFNFLKQIALVINYILCGSLVSNNKEEPLRSINEEFAERTHLPALQPHDDSWISIISKFYLCFFPDLKKKIGRGGGVEHTYQPTCLINIDTQILTKHLQIELSTKRKIHHDQVRFISGMQRMA